MLTLSCSMASVLPNDNLKMFFYLEFYFKLISNRSILNVIFDLNLFQ